MLTRLILRAGLFALLLSLGACSSLPKRGTPPVTVATEQFRETALALATQDALPNDARSGFRLLPIASISFATRVQLTKMAQHTLDVQYYLLRNDETGLALIAALRDAAARGVRVRILIDDLYEAGEDAMLSDLAALPHIEVRLFNPFAGGRSGFITRFLASAADFRRVNHRMHNKLFIADNAAAVVGGRNIADEYFMHSAQSNFIDLDIFAAGPVVRDLSGLFDLYWNNEHVYPVQLMTEQHPSVERARAEIDNMTHKVVGPTPDNIPMTSQFHVYTTLPQELELGKVVSLIPAQAQAFADSPNKVDANLGASSNDVAMPTVTRTVLKLFASSRSEVQIASPYFIPGDAGIAMMQDAHNHGVKVRVITNSMASTDEPLVHFGYQRYRKQMLKAGVELREVSPTLSRDRKFFGRFGVSTGSLHSKVAFVDQRKMFIGSMNLDARSARKNTEIGMIIDSPELCAQVAGLVDNGSFYHLRLAANGEDIEWVQQADGGELVLTDEPEIDWWRRFKAWLAYNFVPDEEL